MATISQYIDQVLRRAPLFSALNQEQLAALKETMRIITLQEGERLFDMDQHAERFFLLRRGQIKLYRTSMEGNEKVFEIVVPGGLFAEAVMFMEHRRYPVSATALTETELFAFSNQTFLELLQDNTDLCLRLMADLSKWLHQCLIEIDSLTLQNATFRVVNYLLELLPSQQVSRATIELPAPKHVIASRLSIKPETFSRIFHNLTQAGIIAIDGALIHVHDAEQLRNLIRLPVSVSSRAKV